MGIFDPIQIKGIVVNKATHALLIDNKVTQDWVAKEKMSDVVMKEDNTITFTIPKYLAQEKGFLRG